jgi:hypothetical protein
VRPIRLRPIFDTSLHVIGKKQNKKLPLKTGIVETITTRMELVNAMFLKIISVLFRVADPGKSRYDFHQGIII